MCLILDQRAGYSLPRRQLRTIIHRNADGFGAMWGDGRRLHLVRMVGTPDELADAYAPHAGKRRVLHWRLGTHGDNGAGNAHPFPLTDDVAVMHNGMLSCGTPEAGRSDTAHLADYILRPIAERDPNRLFCPAFAQVLAGLIGSGNKLAMAHADGRVALVGRSRGVDYAGCWWSNTYAWDAPASAGGYHRATVGYHTGSYAASRYGVGPTTRWDDDTADLWAPRTVVRTMTPLPPAPASQEAPMGTLRAAASGGVDGVAAWAHARPDAAALVLTAAYDLTPDEGRQLAECPDEAAPWLLDAVQAAEDSVRMG